MIIRELTKIYCTLNSSASWLDKQLCSIRSCIWYLFKWVTSGLDHHMTSLTHEFAKSDSKAWIVYVFGWTLGWGTKTHTYAVVLTYNMQLHRLKTPENVTSLSHTSVLTQRCFQRSQHRRQFPTFLRVRACRHLQRIFRFSSMAGFH